MQTSVRYGNINEWKHQCVIKSLRKANILMATYVIRYRSKGGVYSYLSKKCTFKRNYNNSEVLVFNKKSKAKNYMSGNISANTMLKILRTHVSSNFEIINIENSNENAAPLAIDSSLTFKKNCPTIEQIETLDKLVKRLNEVKDHAMVLDLEFFQDKRSDHQNDQHMKQIAGFIFSNPKRNFSEYVFDSKKMKETDQLQFLKKSNFNYADACDHDSDYAIQKVKEFAKLNQVTTIISWGNSFDFKILNDEGHLQIFHHMTAIDVERVFAKVNGLKKQKNSGIGLYLNLNAVCNILNLKNDGTWHEALSDCRMIKKVCDLYMNVLMNRHIIAMPVRQKEAEEEKKDVEQMSLFD